MEQIFHNVRCSNGLHMLKHLEIDTQFGLITCVPCSKYLLSTIKSSFSVFEYVEQDVHKIQSQQFRSLKKILKIHYSNKFHIWRVEKGDYVVFNLFFVITVFYSSKVFLIIKLIFWTKEFIIVIHMQKDQTIFYDTMSSSNDLNTSAFFFNKTNTGFIKSRKSSAYNLEQIT
jgi:hypothetical protein